MPMPKQKQEPEPKPVTRESLQAMGEDPDDVYRGFTMLELHQAMRLVQNAENWKLPIDKIVKVESERQILAIHEATVFFAGSPAEVWPVAPNAAPGQPHRWYRVVAAGYYACIGS